MSKDSKEFLWTKLDQNTFNGTSQMLKAAVPYMNPQSGKLLAMLARIIELKHTMTMFDEEQISICSVSEKHRPDIEDILKDIRKYCAPNEAEQIDQFLNILNAVRLYNQYTEITKNSDFSNMMNQINSLKNMNMNISPEQMQLFQNFIHTQSSNLKNENASK